MDMINIGDLKRKSPVIKLYFVFFFQLLSFVATETIVLSFPVTSIG